MNCTFLPRTKMFNPTHCFLKVTKNKNYTMLRRCETCKNCSSTTEAAFLTKSAKRRTTCNMLFFIHSLFLHQSEVSVTHKQLKLIRSQLCFTDFFISTPGRRKTDLIRRPHYRNHYRSLFAWHWSPKFSSSVTIRFAFQISAIPPPPPGEF